MAVPPDVIGGETITSEWGNDIRDWATSSIAFAGTVENSSVATTSTLTAGATVSFVPHATWGTYQMMAWGEAVLTQNTGSASSGQTRIGIGVDYGASLITVATVANGAAITVPAFHFRTAISGTLNVSLQYRHVSGAMTKSGTTIHYIATRLT